MAAAEAIRTRQCYKWKTEEGYYIYGVVLGVRGVKARMIEVTARHEDMGWSTGKKGDVHEVHLEELEELQGKNDRPQMVKKEGLRLVRENWTNRRLA